MDNKNRLFDLMKKIDNSFKLKTINESINYTDNNFKFIDDKMNVEFLNYKFNIENNNDIYIKWGINFWINENGIEDISILVYEIGGTYKIYHDDENNNIIKNINEFDWNFNIDYNNLFKDKSLYINTVIFDFKQKECTIIF